MPKKFLKKTKKQSQRRRLNIINNFLSFFWQPSSSRRARGKYSQPSKSAKIRFIIPNKTRWLAKGFVLPTVTMLLLVMSLVVSALLLRTSQHTEQAIGVRQAQMTYNLATPAIERAKSKIEFLFKRDYRFPNGIPNESTLKSLMLNEEDSEVVSAYEEAGKYVDIYSLPGETRIDINGDEIVDNAWAFDTDIDGDGKTETVAYSILMNTAQNNVTLDDSPTVKASNLVTRTGPLTIQNADSLSNCNLPDLQVEGGWYPINTASVRKNFQVNAVVSSKNTGERTVSSLEFQQDRQLDRGNKWGVWFRYDLEIFPGPDFNMNGAMHTEGNMIWGQNSNKDKFHAHLISSPFSCLYTEDASEITMTQLEDANGNITFQGQAINGAPAKSNYSGTSSVDIFPGAGEAPSGNQKLKKDTDSVKDVLQVSTSKPAYDYALNPIPLFTEDKSQSRYEADPTNVSIRDSDWNTSNLARRMINKVVRKPYVDDTYRADNRWGPKPTYTSRIKVPAASDYGQPITLYLEQLTLDDPPTAFPEQVGLDGYWERRARVNGLRLIVGQRLELGNSYGWLSNDDPLYPPNETVKHLDRQRRTLRDNLAAVQSTLVYHASHDQDFPIATLATTVHNGTQKLKENSTNFETLAETNKLNINFLEGIGTNGWEFNPPGNASTEEDFKALIATGQPLRIALDNLANFTGDYSGAFPPVQEKTLGKPTHPYPNLTMWGNFSNLRRAMLWIRYGIPYDSLSLADRTTIQTAAASVGMLAYNLDHLQQAYQVIANDTSAKGLNALGEHLWTLVDGNNSNGEVNTLINSAVALPNGYNRSSGAADFYGQFTPAQYIEALSAMSTLGGNKDELVKRAKIVAQTLQVERDRTLGFATSQLPKAIATSTWNESNGAIEPTIIPDNTPLRSVCDPETFTGLSDQAKVGLAVAFCSEATTPKYPSLYYLFPNYQHDQIGKGNSISQDDQPSSEPYIADTEIYDPVTNQGMNTGVTYKIIKNTADNGIGAIALQPLARTDWKLPSSTTNTKTGNKIKDNGTTVYLALQDKAFYEGRQLMQIRTLDIDLNLLRNNTISGDTWLPVSGIVYAFREDALREDMIARPTGKTWTDCNTETKMLTAACRMDANIPQDPPNNEITGVSPKAIDYYPDPDRRPYGFRLKNGKDLSRANTIAGLSFISDNPVFIFGDLNHHVDSNGNREEEFTSNLNNNWSNFYSRKTLNTDFANAAKDRWRPTEILGDSLTILSDDFCDGTVEDGWQDNDNNSGCNSGGLSYSSYRNSVLIDQSQFKKDKNKKVNGNILLREYTSNESSGWAPIYKRENQDDNNSPILIDRNAKTYMINNDDGSEMVIPSKYYHTLSEDKTLNKAGETRVNTIFVSGITPSRVGQSFGGLHNFPRFIQTWSGKNLHISGALIQLNFSTYATGPFEQEAWEPGQTPANRSESIEYYSPPNRRWGYDVALQYSPAGPVASRFINIGSPRNEFYQNTPADDPYVRQLRCAKVNGQPIDPKATDCS
ncbi:MAG: hormogonium polysaccharide biosynthesis protein HpsA [Microcystaceae cyanobacterium]